jgi:hypothetical protein
VSETTGSGRSLWKRPRIFLAYLRTKARRTLLLAAIVGGVIGYIFGMNMASFDISAATDLIQQLRAESQKLKQEILEQNAKHAALQAKLAGIQATLEAIMPTQNTYNLSPNQSLIVAEGRLTVGLIGSPGDERINLNVNGKQQAVATGEIIKVALDGSTTCQVQVQSFDMFKAIVTASCPTPKPQ